MCLRAGLFAFLLIVASAVAAQAQREPPPRYQFSAGFAAFSNSPNGLPGSHQPLTGWNASAVLPAWHNLRFKVDVSAYSGSNLSTQQNIHFILGGGQYERTIGREGVFVQALFGNANLNRPWGPHGLPGGTAAFSELLGGGVDTPVSRRFALRVEADMQHADLALIQSVSDQVPYHFSGIPNYFGRYSAGIVWTPIEGSRCKISDAEAAEPVENEIAFESLNSFGHYHVFAYTWWSYLNVAGVEYDRHSWGRALGAQMDYVAEILPIVILRQPSKTDVFGDPLSTGHTTVAGLAITPVGLRMLWRSGHRVEPYYTIKGGMIGFTQKALSRYASYEDFTLQQAVGMEFHLSDRVGIRTGVSDFHFSNAFIVPNDPGIDEMSWTVGASYGFRSGSLRF